MIDRRKFLKATIAATIAQQIPIKTSVSANIFDTPPAGYLIICGRRIPYWKCRFNIKTAVLDQVPVDTKHLR